MHEGNVSAGNCDNDIDTGGPPVVVALLDGSIRRFRIVCNGSAHNERDDNDMRL